MIRSTSKFIVQLQFGLVSCTAFLLIGAIPTRAEGGRGSVPSALLVPSSSGSQTQTAANAGASSVDKISTGTILPVVLRSSFSMSKAKAGEQLHGNIAQEVLLGNGAVIHKGAKVEGHIVDVTPNANAAGERVKVQFDKVYMNGQWVPVVTDLRAIAGFMTVIEAGVPVQAPGEGDVYNWLTKEQIGGDTDYGVGGPVQSADSSKIIGKYTGNGAVGQVTAREGTNCRGPVDNNNNPQALWVFSSGACGAYGIEHLQIEHAGRTDPVGTILLVSDAQNVKLRDGDGLLLRVN
jgi:hypothetical protein